ncbi:MAG: hypothetical protein ACE5KM_22950 [Planctomycetaceae bacterium]
MPSFRISALSPNYVRRLAFLDNIGRRIAYTINCSPGSTAGNLRFLFCPFITRNWSARITSQQRHRYHPERTALKKLRSFFANVYCQHYGNVVATFPFHGVVSLVYTLCGDRARIQNCNGLLIVHFTTLLRSGGALICDAVMGRQSSGQRRIVVRPESRS